MWSYLMWELPPRCEVAAKRLEERSTLFAGALKASPADEAEAARQAEDGAAAIGAADAPLLRGPQ